jgi:hypothetical protein
MSSVGVRPDVALELSRLKNFQRDTVEYVFSRMYNADAPVRRFLVADEVGLGKTMVARGVVAKAIDHLWETVKRIDIVYICSNGSIARQNINRLNVSGAKDASLPSRITLLPTVVRGLEHRRVNFISLTPQTSFDLRSNLGTYEERALLYHLVPDDWKTSAAAVQNLLQGGAGRDAFRQRVKDFDVSSIDEHLRGAYRDQLNRHADLRGRFAEAAGRFSNWRQTLPPEDWALQRELVGTLRQQLAVSCLGALQPDLIILDEFQRFKHLLDGTDTASALAQELFNFGDARVLLLSATPYKMYTIAEEAQSDDHFRDFLQTVRFLQADESRTEGFKKSLDSYRNGLFALGTPRAATLDEARASVQADLRRVMVRTERLAASADRNGMLCEVSPKCPLTAADVSTFIAYAKAAETLGHPEIAEYWKSAPFLFNFMDDYQLKEAFKKATTDAQLIPALRDALKGCSQTLLDWDDVERYRQLDPANARLRHLIADVIDQGAWRFLWLPPSMPYYEPAGAFASADAARVTKRLIFSSWQVVPKVVAALVSYEAERHMFGDRHDVERPNTVAEREKFSELLRFGRTADRSTGLTGMALMSLLYPAVALAELGDPLRMRRSAGEGRGLTRARVVDMATEMIRPLLASLGTTTETSGAEDQAWYWAAPILLDLKLHAKPTRGWLDQPDLSSVWRDPEGTPADDEAGRSAAWDDHVAMFRRVASGQETLGRQPSDLAEVLARVALGSPAICALRALARTCGKPEALNDKYVRNSAGAIGWGFRSLFNLPEVTALLRRESEEDERYWQRVLEYAIDGNLQSVLDEYVHVAQEAEGVAHHPYRHAARAIAKRVSDALQLRTATMGVDVVALENGGIRLEDRRMRARFAARFGAQQTEEGASAVRADDVRAAFNSPFWPFVLCSTSVGQEGLDFHLYCHAVVHWNLPSNPVDLEQREGRVHRYKGHAIRKNTAMLFGEQALHSDAFDPWCEAFEAASRDRPDGASDLTPFWVLCPEGGARIERHIPSLPLSRDVERAAALRKTLTMYRMAFGQSRQDDLVAYLMNRFPPEEIQQLSARLKIDLTPDAKATVIETVRSDRKAGEIAGDTQDLAEGELVRLPLTLERARSLLDAFASAAADSARAGVEQYRDLLDRFVALKEKE